MATMPIPHALPEVGLGALATLNLLAPLILGGATRLGHPAAMAQMDPPTPWISWATTLWNASLNQNLLHPATAPVARDLEARVVDWLALFFGMDGGHMVPGSTVANLTALWAARECAGVQEVAYAETAHLSVAKAAHILGLPTRPLPCWPVGSLLAETLQGDLSRTALVLTAGATSTGAVDDLCLIGGAAWTHVDAAWAGPLRLRPQYSSRLSGIERADSVAISAHKWLFQPKGSALVLFRDATHAHAAMSFGGAYLKTPNVGVLGSHGAVAVPLLASLLAWGRKGIAARIEKCMAMASEFSAFISADKRLELLALPETGLVVWRPVDTEATDRLHAALPPGSTSLTSLPSGRWLRNVAANPSLDLGAFTTAANAALNDI
ncbi:MAG: pyridoxal-dependent decarboxylase [Hyphomonas sp.]|uniref:aspartate aminotransferase family protein n=1 Tax=Hyphomonas sp. TaxID=87 RepID=UPI0034A08B1D